MKEDNIYTNQAKDFYYIGERLKQIREELQKEDPISDKNQSVFSRKNTAKKLAVNYTTIANVERGPMSINTIKLMLLYYSYGYNIMWIISPENQFMPKKNIGENLVYQSEVQENYKVLYETILKSLVDFKGQI